MNYRVLRVVMLAALLLLLALPPQRSGAQAVTGDDRPDQIVLSPQPGLGFSSSAGYLSDPVQAARPFTHMLVRREAHVPAGASLTLAVRASPDGARWSDWSDLLDNDDLWTESDGPDVEWSQMIDVGVPARFWQVRGSFAAASSGELPELRHIAVNTVDALAFGSASGQASTSPAQSATPSLATATKPTVVSRVAWGSPDGEGSRVPPAYYPVNHMVVHHTADSNTLFPSEPNWAARVRAEWAFHTYTRGWGDVGYNYLIDPNGVIYEGRAGGDDAVAFHDTANYGSMGVVLIGTYATVTPTPASQDSLTQLLAWKAAQKRIDPLGSSYYYGCAASSYCYPYNPGAVVPNIAGHRQVTPGHTSCPGDSLLGLLPGIRNRVKQILSGGNTEHDNGDLTVDELESGFARSNATWHDASCGYGGHTFWTYATSGAAENSATWRPNIPATGTYRVYAYVPQGCGLAASPYASTQARYSINYAGGVATKVVDHNTATVWVDLGAYTFNQGSSGAVELYDNTGEPLSDHKVLFFDAIKWVPETASANIDLVGVSFDRTTIASGELLKATFTVRNSGTTTLHTQDPQAGTAPDGSFNDALNGRSDDAYVYDEGECFLGNSAGSYSAFPKETDRFRVVLGPTDTSDISCAGAFGDYPWRWGLNGDLAPGETRAVVAYVRFRNSGLTNRSVTLRAGIVQEYVRYFVQGANTTTITVTPERIAPDAASYDERLAPLAQVYRLASVPDNFLARTRNPLSITRGGYVGSFAWNGGLLDWGSGGPLGLTDQFLIEQTRTFVAPVSGEYTFRTTSDDGSWLWIDGQPVIVNSGLHAANDMTGTISLSAGVHSLAYKYFERTGSAAAGYSIRLPGEDSFRTVSDAFDGALHLGNVFIESPDLVLSADDQGGSGIDHIHWSRDGANWNDTPGAALHLGVLSSGSYHLRYQAVDAAGNQGSLRELSFNVNTDLSVYRSYLPVTGG